MNLKKIILQVVNLSQENSIWPDWWIWLVKDVVDQNLVTRVTNDNGKEMLGMDYQKIFEKDAYSTILGIFWPVRANMLLALYSSFQIGNRMFWPRIHDSNNTW